MEKLFIKMPVWIKGIAFLLISISEKRNRKGKNYKHYKNEFILNAKKGIDNNNVIKERALKIVSQIPFYNKYKLAAFEDIPIVDKTIINNNYEMFSNMSIKPFKVLKTSGTSGQSLTIPVSKSMFKKKFAGYDAFRELNEMSSNVPNANFFGRTIFSVNQKKAPFWLYSFITKQLVLSQYHLNDRTISDYLNALEKYRIEWIHGYPSFLNLFSELIIEANLVQRVRLLGIKNISTGSETLLSFQKENIENVFGCEILNFYGQGESVAHIYTYNNQLFVDKTFSYVEFIPYKDDLFHIVGTQIDNECLTLIRYNTGDLARLNYKGEVVEIIGRIEDYIYLKDGTKISRLDHIFKSVENIREAKIIQKEKGSAKFLINTTDIFSDNDLDTLKKSVQNKLGKDFNFLIEKVDHIPKTSMGKLKFVECLVKENSKVNNN